MSTGIIAREAGELATAAANNELIVDIALGGTAVILAIGAFALFYRKVIKGA